MNPGTGGNQYNVAFNVAASGLGILTPDPNFYWNTFAGMTFYYNPADTLLYLSASDANAQSIGAGLVKVCLEMVDENDQTPPSACGAAQPVKRQLWAEYVDGSGGGWVGYDTDVNGLKWSIPSVSVSSSYSECHAHRRSRRLTPERFTLQPLLHHPDRMSSALTLAHLIRQTNSWWERLLTSKAGERTLLIATNFRAYKQSTTRRHEHLIRRDHRFQHPDRVSGHRHTSSGILILHCTVV